MLHSLHFVTARGIAALLLAALTLIPVLKSSETSANQELALQEYSVQAGSRPHDAVPDANGWAWYAGQGNGTVGRVDPATGATDVITIAPESRPHGVIIGPDAGVWLTDGGLNAIVRVDPSTFEIQVFPLPADKPNANLNTATFDGRGVLWFTGQNGIFGRLDPRVGVVQAWDAPRGRGPYGIATTPDGTVYYASLAGSYLGRIDSDDGSVTVIDPPTPNAGVRRVWSDSTGRLWVSEYNAGQVGVYDPANASWKEWRLPGSNPAAYSVFVDERDKVWLTDTNADTVVMFDPVTEAFTTVNISKPSNVAQMGGKRGEVWGAQRARDHIFVVRYDS